MSNIRNELLFSGDDSAIMSMLENVMENLLFPTVFRAEQSNDCDQPEPV